MADILGGNPQYSTFAPLSHGQTVSMCKHLEEQIQMLTAKVGDLQMELGKTNDGVSAVRNATHDLHSKFGFQDTGGGLDPEKAKLGMQSMVDNLSKTAADLEQTRKDMGRTNNDVKKLQVAVDNSQENIAALHQGQKVNNVNLQKVVTDLAQTTDVTANLRSVIEKRVLQDIEKLRDELSKTNLKVSQLREDTEQNRSTLHQHKEELRSQNTGLQALRDELAKSNTHIQLTAQRFVEMDRRLKDTKMHLDDTHAAMLRLSEDHDTVAGNVTDCQGNLRKVTAHVKQVQDGLEKTSSDLHTTRGQLGSTIGVLDSTRQHLEQTKLTVRTLKEGHEIVNAKQNVLAGQLEATQMIAHETKKVLNQTNNLVLPNLNIDTGSNFANTVPSSARSKQHSKKSSGNGAAGGGGAAAVSALSMDRMAWI